MRGNAHTFTLIRDAQKLSFIEPIPQGHIMHIVIKAMLIVAGVIHILPLPGLIGATHLERLYGITFNEPNLLIMMRHRAILFSLLGAFMIYAAFRADFVSIAIMGGLVSTAAFIWLAWSIGGYNSAIYRIVIADWIAVGCLVIATVCHFVVRHNS